MPVTTRPSPEKKGKYSGKTFDPQNLNLPLVNSTLQGCEDVYKDDTRRPEDAKRMLLSSSFDNWKGESPVIPYENGFVHGSIRAFENDLHLVIRPDDVWLSILTQFSMFVNGNAELVRSLFVTHEGQKELIVDMTPFELAMIDLGRFAQEMTSVIQENVVDPELKMWMTPNFTTTTDGDKSVASFVMMGTLKRYFSYSGLCGCGFPSVTLLGQRSDWVELDRKVQIFPKYGDEPSEWTKLLRPVIKYMIMTFDKLDSKEVKDFWLQICHTAGPAASGTQTLSGWITAFAFWSETGDRINAYSDDDLIYERTSLGSRKRLELDGSVYPLISPSSVPKGVITLPMTLRDGDACVDRYVTVLAGSVAMSLSAEASTVQPLSGWWAIQEWTEKLTITMGRRTGDSVTGSTTDGASDRASTSENGSDSVFDDGALP